MSSHAAQARAEEAAWRAQPKPNARPCDAPGDPTHTHGIVFTPAPKETPTK